ncbi:hypothetical protein D9M68_873240 [compost metagenome]
MLHQPKALLYQRPPDHELGRAVGQVWVQAARGVWVVQIPGVHDQVIEPGHLQQVATPRVEGFQHDQRADARLQRAVEGVGAGCKPVYRSHGMTPSLASRWQVPCLTCGPACQKLAAGRPAA